MSEATPEIQSIPIDRIAILNPLVRNKKIFNELVASIAHLGLKKPITVSLRADGSGYDLVCGQGRLEAFLTWVRRRYQRSSLKPLSRIASS